MPGVCGKPGRETCKSHCRTMKGTLKIFPALLLVCGLAGCGAGKAPGMATEVRDTPEPINPKDKTASRPPVLTASQRMARAMNYLASDAQAGRDTGSRGIERAALFLEDQLRVNQVGPYFETYRDTLSNMAGTAYNIVGLVEGKDPILKNEYILIGAHYDHIGIVPAQSMDSIANGANDNASGTTVVLELARYFGRERTNGRSLIFVLFSAEEKGLLGSRHLAKKLQEQQLPLYLMLNFEMTGVPLANKGYMAYVTGYEKSNLADICNRYAGENLIGFLPTAEEYGLFQRSDNYPFHLEFNVPSQTFCTFDFTNFDHYHKVGDEVSLMDMEHMAVLVNKLIPVIEGIANHPEKEIIYR